MPWEAALLVEVPREGAWGRRAGLPVCLRGFISMSSLSKIMRRVKRRLRSLLSFRSLRVALPLVTLFAPWTEHLLQARASNGWFLPCAPREGQEIVQMSLSALLLWGLSEPAQLSALAPPAPFFPL